MELHLRQGFGSPSADFGMAAHLPPGLFAGRRKLTSSRKSGASSSVATPGRAAPSVVESTRLQLEEVVERLKRGQSLTPNDAVAAFDLGWAYRTLGRWAESAATFTKAIEFLARAEDRYRDLNLATAYYMRGYAHASLAVKQEGDDKRRNFEKAENDYLQALKLKKDYMIVYCYLGVLYGMQERWIEAQRALKRATKLKPRYSGAHHDLGVIYMQSGQPRLALKAFEKAVESEPKNLLSLRHLADAYYEAERWADARRILLRLLKLDPEDREALYKLGGAYLQLGDYPKAEQSLRTVIEIDPDAAGAYSNLGTVYIEWGRLGDAAEAFNHACKLGHPGAERIGATLNGIQIAMLNAVAGGYLEMLSYGVRLDADSLVAQVGKVREIIQGGKQAHLDYPGSYFSNQLTHIFTPIAEQLDEETRFQLGAKLLERGLLLPDHASQLAGRILEVANDPVAVLDDKAPRAAGTGVEGIYRQGKVELLETPAEAREEECVLVTFVGDRSVSLAERGIDAGQASDLRSRLSAFVEDWERPEMGAYDAL